MATSPTRSSKHAQLRSDAEGQLSSGTAPPTTGVGAGLDALSLLHRLASSPASAGDALKLLHELQVHQVELDLQHEQIEAGRCELAEEIAHYKDLFHCAPIAYLNVGCDGRVIEANQAAAELFALELDELRGRAIDTLLAREDAPAIQALLERQRDGTTRQDCAALTAAGQAPGHPVRISASTHPGDGTLLLMVAAATDEGAIHAHG